MTARDIRHSPLLHAAKIGRGVASDDKFLREGREEDYCITPRSLPTSIATFQPSTSPFSSSFPFSCARARFLVILFLPLVFRASSSPRRYVTSYRYLIKGCPIIFFYHARLRSVRRVVAPSPRPSLRHPASGKDRTRYVARHRSARASSLSLSPFLSFFFPPRDYVKQAVLDAGQDVDCSSSLGIVSSLGRKEVTARYLSLSPFLTLSLALSHTRVSLVPCVGVERALTRRV